jgi:hypothetical protein
VSGIVEPGFSDACLVEEVFPRLVVGLRVEGASVGLGEDEVVVFPQ